MPAQLVLQSQPPPPLVCAGDGVGATERVTVGGELAVVAVTVFVLLAVVLAVIDAATDELVDGDALADSDALADTLADALADVLADTVGVGVQNDAHVGKSTRQSHVCGQPM